MLCPGCGGRNDPAARTCYWCGRLFVVEHWQITAPWLAPLTTAFIAFVALATIAMALVGARTSAGAGADAWPAPATVPESPALRSAEAEQTAGSDAQPPTEFVRIADTGGAGAFIRREPGSAAASILAHREGTILRVVGPDRVAEGRVWRQVEDSQANRGWTPQEFLVPSDVGF